MDKIRKAAIILLGLGEEYAEQILKNMTKAEVHKIMEVINTIDNVSEDDVIHAMDEFFNASDNTGIDIVSKENIKNTLVSALGIKGMEKVDIEKSKWIELLKYEPLSSVLELIEDEHPQVLTALVVILTQLGSERASEIIKGQKKEMQNEIIKRMSYIGPISTYALEALSIFFENELSRSDRYGVVTVDGVDAAANLISYLDSETEREIIADLSNTDKKLAEQIQDKLLPFEKLAYLDTRSLQILLKEITPDDLVLALKGSNEYVKSTFMKNMSTKAAEILKDDLESKGPVKLSNVIEAQKKIVLLAKKLSKEEKIILSTKSDPDVIF
ncbi:Flagellar motor switch protein FliG [Aquicella siphonis]|uniref:Flagellar motor switch protein FliG n=1 Tax=Aquicella siphonis TaxID=254247 RepID=A0A5E4PKN0_9COXI|nr:FliG C-terminal domain-containing protein [Aquicella siphonis]VVC77108.1 Flagellar motor switch protein FliG [Aquicella siphonis]